MSTKLDIIVVGATGYTGRITCKYLNTIASVRGHWGIAARSERRMTKLKKELGVEVPSFVIDLTKPATLDAVCKRATCILSCAGPFTLVGMPIVDACMRNSCHYVDSTGEFNFVRTVIEKYEEEAKTKGVSLVPCCGFDCIPSDLGNYAVHHSAEGDEVTDIKAYYTLTMAGVSSGTANSIGHVFSVMTPADMSPVSLVPKDAPAPRSAPSSLGMWFDWRERCFTAPYIMAMGNERIVRRTNALMGSRATYSEVVSGSFWSCLKTTLSFYAVSFVLGIAPLRRWALARFYPADATTGPAEAAKAKSRFSALFVGHTTTGKRIATTVADDREMYDLTGVLLSQCALCTVEMAKKKTLKGGVKTPCSAFGEKLMKRCTATGMHISTTVEVAPSKRVKAE